MKKVREIDDTAMCISRIRRGKGYCFYNENGERITDKKTLTRLRKLVIPPMWNEVYACRFDDGHIQATGRDLKGRKQYIYHSIYEKKRQEEKFRKMLDFSKVLPKIRKQAHRDLNIKEWGKSKLLALIVLILDEYGIRIGNKEYKKQNDSYGLTTLRRKHLSIDDDELVLSFKGKSNQEQQVYIDNEELIPFITKAASLPGYEIFRYKDRHGVFHDVDSEDVNCYIADYMGPGYTSKDFRTWAANRLAVEFYPIAMLDNKIGGRKKFSNIIIKMVASELGNTPSVCRNYYVHPAIFNAIDEKSLPNPNPYRKSKNKYGLTPSEKLARKVIEKSSKEY
ncbi:DNA topoisomerase IB [Arenibacter algicola]|uniref:DNA topoisomerase IB n=1 Tax=Arenibacter algicola TaxID=616991 RepID=UPI002091DE5B|nr:DNA topoisomerase IB [Arenibacter algicola]